MVGDSTSPAPRPPQTDGLPRRARQRTNASVQFIDEVTVDVQAGDGGNGCVAMRREKFRPLGGPSGGNGGHGADVILRTDERLGTLIDLRLRPLLRGKRGEHGRGKDQHGAAAAPLVIRVPVGTQVYDADSGELLADLDETGIDFVAAAGGRGGRGNMAFATPYNRAPKHAEPGQPGEKRRLRLELKLIADVGLVGFPNAGKSTLIATVSRAKPKVAGYPFTTLAPNLGVVSLGDERSFVLADIPGIIEGASEGSGLGLRFLKHIERTRVLLYLVTVDPDPDRSPLDDLDTLRGELQRFDPELTSRPSLVALSKLDMPEARQAQADLEAALRARGIDFVAFSSVTREGLDALLEALWKKLTQSPFRSEPRKQPLPLPPHKKV